MKKLSKNSIYIILNLLYIIPGTYSALLYVNIFYHIFEVHNILSGLTDNIFGYIILVPWIIFYFMALRFTILIHPVIQIIIYILVWKNNFISKKYIIIVFIISMAIAFVYLYLIWVKGDFLTA